LTEIAEDQEYFPTKYGIEFNPGLITEYRRICRILYAILSHMYANHYSQLQQFGDMHLYLNTLFTHLILLGDEYGLIDSADRVGLDDLIGILAPKGSIVTSSSFNYVQSSTIQPKSEPNSLQNAQSNSQNNQQNHQNTSVSTSSPPNTPAANNSSSANFKISANQPIFTQTQSSDIINNQTTPTAFYPENDQMNSITVQTPSNQSNKIPDAALKTLTLKSSKSHEEDLNNRENDEIGESDPNESAIHESANYESAHNESSNNESFKNESAHSVRNDSLQEIEGEGDNEYNSTVRERSPIEDSSGIRISVIASKVQDKNYENEGDEFQREAKPDYNNNETVML
jgi:hypothetical protein